MCSHLCLPTALMSWHWRKLFLVPVKYKTFFAVRNFHNSVLLICGTDSQIWANCKIVLVRSEPALDIHHAPDSDVISLWGVWPCFSCDSSVCGTEQQKEQPGLLRKAESGPDYYIWVCCSCFVRSWVTPQPAQSCLRSLSIRNAAAHAPAFSSQSPVAAQLPSSWETFLALPETEPWEQRAA